MRTHRKGPAVRPDLSDQPAEPASDDWEDASSRRFSEGTPEE